MHHPPDLSDSNAFVDGFTFEFFAELRARGGLYWHDPTDLTPDGEGFWVASRYADVIAVLGDATRFTSGGTSVHPRGGTSIANADIVTEHLTTSEGARHQRMRALVEQGISKEWLNTYRVTAGHRVHDALDHLLATDSSDFVRAAGYELGSHVVFDLLGVPDADRRQIVDWTLGNADGETDSGGPLKREAYFRDFVSEASPDGPGILGALFRARLPDSPDSQLTSAEILAFCNVIYPIGAIACANAMAGAVKAFCDTPSQYRHLLDDPGAADSGVEEILRWSTPALYARRTALCDAQLSGSRILAGQKVTGWWASANRDEQVFTNPDQFDVTRTPNPHLSFGSGPHDCLSAGITRIALRSFLAASRERVEQFEMIGDVAWAANNRFYGLTRLPVRLTGK